MDKVFRVFDQSRNVIQEVYPCYHYALVTPTDRGDLYSVEGSLYSYDVLVPVDGWFDVVERGVYGE